MKPTPTSLLVKVDGVFDNEVGGLKDKEGNEITLLVDTTYNPMEHIKSNAEVYSVPDKYDSTDVLTSQHSNFPQSRHEHHKFHYVRDYPKPDVAPGDKLYFHYTAISEETEERVSMTHIGTSDSKQIHTIDNKLAYCYVRDGKINMLFGYVLVKAIEGTNETESGIITSLDVSHALNVGVVQHISPSDFKLSRTTVSPGDEVLYLTDSDFKVTIEGEDYFMMKEWDIIAKKEGGVYNPVNDYLLISPYPEEEKLLHTKKKDKFGVALVIETGEKCEEELDGDVIYAKVGSQVLPFGDDIFIRKQQVIARYG